MVKGRPVSKKGLTKRILTAIAVIGLLLALVDYHTYPSSSIKGKSRNHAQNGLWLRYTWYFGEKSLQDFDTLAHLLERRQIRFAYFHVRSVQSDGALKYRFPKQAKDLNEAIHRWSPSVLTFAWVYIDRKVTDLSQADTRKRVVSEAIWLTTECGFDGVQFDYEICPEGDPNQLKLIHETRAALTPGKQLSLAGSMNYPWPLGHWGWSEDYFSKLAIDLDQICVMGYDSGCYHPRLYAALLKRQIIRVPQAVHQSNPECQVLLGLPTYGEGTFSHNPQAENLRVALKAVREAPLGSQLNGIALFADYTTEEDEWKLYERYWLGF
jgi:hypothetical protein